MIERPCIGCGRPLTEEEQHYYGQTCESCEGEAFHAQEDAELGRVSPAPQACAAPAWQPIETAPAGDEVLVALAGPRVTVAIKSMGEFFDQCGMPDHFDRLPKCSPTHWMPLPAPPSPGEQKKAL